MRVVFLILLLANLFLLAFNFFGGAGERRSAAPEELSADRLKLLGAGETPAQSGAATPAAPASTSVCVAWGVFAEESLAKARAALAPLNLGERLVERSLDLAPKYWVYLPSVERAADTEKKIAELKKLKLGAVSVVKEEGKWRNAISLGVFATEDAANRHLQELTAKGVQGVQTGAYGGAQKQTLFVIRDPSDELAAKLTELSQQFAGTELKPIVCAPQE
jgi:SPOR domain